MIFWEGFQFMVRILYVRIDLFWILIFDCLLVIYWYYYLNSSGAKGGDNIFENRLNLSRIGSNVLQKPIIINYYYYSMNQTKIMSTISVPVIRFIHFFKYLFYECPCIKTFFFRCLGSVRNTVMMPIDAKIEGTFRNKGLWT